MEGEALHLKGDVNSISKLDFFCSHSYLDKYLTHKHVWQFEYALIRSTACISTCHKAIQVTKVLNKEVLLKIYDVNKPNFGIINYVFL